MITYADYEFVIKKSDIKNASSMQCNVCGKCHDKVVSFDINGGEYDYDICADCLRGALIALQKS